MTFKCQDTVTYRREQGVIVGRTFSHKDDRYAGMTYDVKVQRGTYTTVVKGVHESQLTPAMNDQIVAVSWAGKPELVVSK